MGETKHELALRVTKNGEWIILNWMLMAKKVSEGEYLSYVKSSCTATDVLAEEKRRFLNFLSRETTVQCFLSIYFCLLS
jgi:hypothetical protein